MNEIEVSYTTGIEVKQLTLRFMLDGNAHILMDRRYHGQAVGYKNQWRISLASKSELNNANDIQTLIEILNEQKLA